MSTAATLRRKTSPRSLRLTVGDDLLALPALLFCVVLVILGASQSDAFLSPFNIGNVLVQSTALMLVAVGQTFAVASGGLDLSVGAIVSLVAVVTAVSFEPLGTPAALVLGIGTGLLVGLINGVGVALALEPFLVTLGTLSIAQGAALLISPTPGGEVPDVITEIARFWGAVPRALPAVLIIVVLAAVLFRHTRTGSHILAVGADVDVARLSGVAPRSTYLKAYLLSSLGAALAAIFLVARTSTGDPTIGAVFTLDSLAAVVLGGTILGGGRASVIGAALGAMALGLLSNALNLLSVPAFYQLPAKGGLVILAVLAPNLIARAVAAQRRRTGPARGARLGNVD